MRLEQYLKEETERDTALLLELAIFMEEYDEMNEAVGNIGKKLKGAFDKLGLHVDTGGTGIIQVLMKGGKSIAQMLWYAAKAVKGDTSAKEKVKEIANTEITKAQMMDFLLKLDMLTLHAITGPIHIIDALTGWHIGTHLKKGAKTVADRIKVAVDNLVDVSDEVPVPASKMIGRYVNSLKKLFLGAT